MNKNDMIVFAIMAGGVALGLVTLLWNIYFGKKV